MSDVVLLGAGGHAKVVASTLLAAGARIEAAYDDAPERQGGTLLGAPIRGPLEAARRSGLPGVVAIGDNATRARVAGLPLEWRTAIHPSAMVDPAARVDAGAVAFARVVVQPGGRIGAHAILNTGAIVDHDGHIGAYAHVGPGATLAGNVEVGEGAFLGAGAIVVPGVRIGAWSVVGAGAVVLRDVADRERVAGVPARPIREGVPR